MPAAPPDYDEAALQRLAERTQQFEPAVDEARPGQTTPKYLLPKEYQEGRLCGPNSLYVLLKLLRRDVQYKEVVGVVPVGPTGATMSDLIVASQAWNLKLLARKQVSPDDLQQARFPLIAHFDTPGQTLEENEPLDHYMVVTGYDQEKRRFHAIDPSSCVFTTLSPAFVSRSFSGHCLILESTPAFSRWAGYFLAAAIVGIVLWWIPLEVKAWRLCGGSESARST